MMVKSIYNNWMLIKRVYKSFKNKDRSGDNWIVITVIKKDSPAAADNAIVIKSGNNCKFYIERRDLVATTETI